LYLLLIHYDGGNIGQFVSDAIRNIVGRFYAAYAQTGGWEGAFYDTGNWYNVGGLAGGNVPIGAEFDASLVVPTSYENCPASVSALACITY